MPLTVQTAQSALAALTRAMGAANAILCHPVVTGLQFHGVLFGLLLGTLWAASGYMRLRELRRLRAARQRRVRAAPVQQAPSSSRQQAAAGAKPQPPPEVRPPPVQSRRLVLWPAQTSLPSLSQCGGSLLLLLPRFC